MTNIVYDKNGDQIPSREFMSMVIILLRKAEKETGMSFIDWLESFEDKDPDLTTQIDDDTSLRLAISKLMRETYPDNPKELNPADWIDEDDEDMPQPMPDQVIEHVEADNISSDDDDDTPVVMKLPEDE